MAIAAPKRLGELGDMPCFCRLVTDFRGLNKPALALFDLFPLDGICTWLCGLLEEIGGCGTWHRGLIYGYAVFSNGWYVIWLLS